MSKRAHVLDREGHRSQDTEVTKKRRQPLPSTGFPLSPPSTLRQEKQPGRVDGWWTELEAPLESGSTSDNEDWEPAPHPHMAAARISPELFTPSPVDPDEEEVEPVTHFLDMAAARISPEILTPSPVEIRLNNLVAQAVSSMFCFVFCCTPFIFLLCSFLPPPFSC